MGIGIASYVSSCSQLGLMRLSDFFVTTRSIPCLGGCTCISIGALIQHMDTRATGVTSDEIWFLTGHHEAYILHPGGCTCIKIMSIYKFDVVNGQSVVTSTKIRMYLQKLSVYIHIM